MAHSFRIAPIVLAAALAAWPHTALTAAAGRVLTAKVPAAALTHLDLTAFDGTVDLKADPNASSTDVTISVAIEPAAPRMGRKRAPLTIGDVALDAVVDANVLRVGLRNATKDNVEAVWTITVPARFSARIEGHDGSLSIEGLAGGVEASLNSGLGGRGGVIIADVPRGRLDLSMGVGDIKAVRRSADFSSAVVSATVGDAELYLLGHEIVAPHKPGPGHKVRLDGKGPDSLSLKVSVGDVSLRIG